MREGDSKVKYALILNSQPYEKASCTSLLSDTVVQCLTHIVSKGKMS